MILSPMDNKKRMEIMFRIGIVFLLFFLGTCLPLLSVPGIGRLINVWWESIYGLGFLAVNVLPNARESKPLLLFGALIWPIVVCVVLYLFSGAVWHSSSPKIRFLSILIAAVSVLCVVPLSNASKPPFNYLPLYSQIMFNIF
jgi:hypothetical protein